MIRSRFTRPTTEQIHIITHSDKLPEGNLENTTINVEPEQTANTHRALFRGARLLTILHNLENGPYITDPYKDDVETHFFDEAWSGHEKALQIARTIARGPSDYDRSQPVPETEYNINPHASIVFSIGEPYLDLLTTRPSDRGAGLGVIIDGQIPLDAVSHRSREVMENLLNRL